MSVITIQGLTKRFGQVTAVDDLNFEVDRGTVVGFLGPNGAGKTTTLRTLLGLVTPTAGSARIDGKPYRELAEQGRTVLVSSHVLAEVAQTVDQVVIIAGGRLVTQSTLSSLTARTDQLVRVRTPQAEALRSLLAAQGIHADPDGADQLIATATSVEVVGQAAAAAGIVIYEMGAERSNLEDVFLQLTSQQGARS
jgi:ABC-type multidrug transport system ATPase subunit